MGGEGRGGGVGRMDKGVREGWREEREGGSKRAKNKLGMELGREGANRGREAGMASEMVQGASEQAS